MAQAKIPAPVLLGALLVALFAACSSDEPGRPAFGQGVYIPLLWQQTREVEGHRVHVSEERVKCASCHEFTATTIGPVSMSECADCHEGESKIAHAKGEAAAGAGEAVPADCTMCHMFTLPDGAEILPEGTGPHLAPGFVYTASDCIRCHANAQGDLPPVVVHKPTDCLACHEPHAQGQSDPAPCSECHSEVSTTHTAAGQNGQAGCTTCHSRQHAPAGDAKDECSACHAATQPIIPQTALFSEGHSECVNCHRPHAFEGEKAATCRSCHEEMRLLGRGGLGEHSVCTNCHGPHDVKSASARACAQCHSAVSPNHPKQGETGTCTGCHDPHPQGTGIGRANDCSSCHTSAGDERAFHGGAACQSCHAPHDFVLDNAGPGLCSKCHESEVRDSAQHPGHHDCSSCHSGLPHGIEGPVASCASCHADEDADAVEGHAKCSSCHEPHESTAVRDCKSCHAKEHRTAPPGHQECVSCHQPHTGRQIASSCKSCHLDEARTPHGRLEADCSGCHRPHGPDGRAVPPTCSSCHKSSDLPGLHAEPRHRNCSLCHTDHGDEKTPTRSVCLSCHQQQSGHYPNAQSCSGCHLFSETH